jgi:chromosome partitioning protein
MLSSERHDIDPQGSAVDWNESRAPDRKLDAIAATAGQLQSRLQQAKGAKADLAIIDTAPHANSAAAEAGKLADLILIPCRPSRFDLRTISTSLEIARLAKTPAVVVINASPRGKLADEARAALVGQGAIVLETIMYQRAAYSHAVIDGQAVHEYEPDGKAAEEINALFAAIRLLLKL